MTWDIMALFAFLAVGVFYGLASGRSRLVAVLFALYTGALLFENLGFVEIFTRGKGLLEIFLWRVGIFAALVLVTLLALTMRHKNKEEDNERKNQIPPLD